MKKEKDVISNIKELIEEEVISPYSTPDGRLLCDVAEKDEPLKQYELRNRELLMVIKGLLSKQGKNLPSTCYGELIDELEYVAYSNKLPYNLSKRCCYHDGIYMYDLNAEEGTSVCIDEEGMFEICTPEKTFFRTKTYASQVAPNWEVDSSELPFYLEKHFNLQDESSFLLMALYLVCAFLGCIISVPAVVLVGEKGSAKTTMLRRLEQIIDPKVTDLGGAPHSAKNMEIRLHNNYFCAFDNLSSKSINRSSSDINGKRVENDYTFIADDEAMKVEITYTFNASELGGKNLVTFEELYDLSNPEEPVKVAEHKDIEDDGQTVLITERIIKIHTTATDVIFHFI